MRQRPLARVPLAVPAALLLALALQAGWQRYLAPPARQAEALAAPPALALLRLSALGEPVALARLLMFHVQSADQGGGGYDRLDYGVLEQWLGRIADLDPQAQYPLLIASHLYADVNDDAKKRQMLEFIYTRFLQDPIRRWPVLAHAAFIARHRLHDLALAQRYARAIRLHATGPQVPNWAKQMEIFILEDMNEVDSAKILLGALLANGQVTDAAERRFLIKRLEAMEKK